MNATIGMLLFWYLLMCRLLFIMDHTACGSLPIEGDSWTALSGDLTRNQERLALPIMGRTQSWDSPWDVGAMSTSIPLLPLPFLLKMSKSSLSVPMMGYSGYIG
jgi:hypothetical protein